jgi:hypothetical protein
MDPSRAELVLTEVLTDRGASRTRRLGLVALLVCALVLSLVLWRRRHPLSLPRSDMDLAQDVEQRNRSGHESAEAVIATTSGFAVVGHTNSRPAGVRKAWVVEFDGVELRARREAVIFSIYDESAHAPPSWQGQCSYRSRRDAVNSTGRSHGRCTARRVGVDTLQERPRRGGPGACRPS